MEPKKISFGFSKITKKINLLPPKVNDKAETKVELIKCLEGQEIKLMEEKPEEKPLTIPVKNLQKTSTALASLLKRRAVLLGEDEPEENNFSTLETSSSINIDETEDIEKRAARELLAEIRKKTSSDAANNLVLPVVKPDDLPLEGAKESTLNDYENIPIQDFGKALLRGMGWTEPLPKINKTVGPPKNDNPIVRPKGMGLGADKALNKKTLLVAPEENEILEVKRNAFVRILGGKHKDLYGQIEGFDDHAGRVIVRLAIGGTKESYNEFLCLPVSKKEYTQYGKCINSSKYDEYKKKENEYGQITLHKKDKDIMEKTLKKENRDAINDKNSQPKDVMKSGTYEYLNEENQRRADYNNDTKNRYKNDIDDQKGTSRNVYIGDNDIVGNHKRYDKKSSRRVDTYKDEQSTKRREGDKIDIIKQEKCQNLRNFERSTSRERDRQRKLRFQYKKDNASDLEGDSFSRKHKKSKNYHLEKKSKKSKKSNKNKSKYKDTSSETETSPCSSETSSDSEEERAKRHKKKTKKSKKPRERSRDRR